jgi:hypothetical protein
VAVTPETLFQYGSITKVWTTTLIMQLVDEGQLSLDTRVVEVLPEFDLADSDAAAAVTVQHLGRAHKLAERSSGWPLVCRCGGGAGAAGGGEVRVDRPVAG